MGERIDLSGIENPPTSMLIIAQSGTNIMWNTELSNYWPFIGFNQIECQLSEKVIQPHNIAIKPNNNYM